VISFILKLSYSLTWSNASQIIWEKSVIKSLSQTFTLTVPCWWNDPPNSARAADSLAVFRKLQKKKLYYIEIWILKFENYIILVLYWNTDVIKLIVVFRIINSDSIASFAVLHGMGCARISMYRLQKKKKMLFKCLFWPETPSNPRTTLFSILKVIEFRLFCDLSAHKILSHPKSVWT